MATLVPLCDLDNNKQSNEIQDEPKSQESPGKISCDICEHKFETIASLSKHNQKVHKINVGSKDKTMCGICGLVFGDKRLLHRHYAKHKYICTVCNKGHSTKAALESHMVVHTGEKKYKCTDCGKSWTTKHHLTLHIKNPCTKQTFLKVSQSEVVPKEIKIEVVNEPIDVSDCDIDNQESQKTHEPKVFPPSDLDNNNQLKETQDKPKSHISPGNISCVTCGTSYKSIASLSKHNKNVHQINQFSTKNTCGICGAAFEDKIYLHKHYAKHKFTCTICNKVNGSKAALESHMVVHTGEKKYKCTACGKSYSRKHPLENHIKTSCPNQMSLKFCQLQVATKSNNMGVDNGSTNTKSCDIDKQDFQDSDQSNIIPMKDETEVEDVPINAEVCNICGEDFKDEASLIKHKVKHGYTCTICNKNFLEKSYLNSHMQIHTGERKYVCEICGKAFRRQSHYVRHKRIHTGEKPYICDICGYAFPVSNELNAHMIKHRDERKYKCSICDKAFKCTKSLKFHSRRHQEISDYKCDVCGKTFTQSGNLKNHMVVHTGEKNHKCLDCGKLFSYKLSLIRHNTKKLCSKQILQKFRQSQAVTKEQSFGVLSEYTASFKDAHHSQTQTKEPSTEELSNSILAELSDSCGDDFHDTELSDSCSQDYQDKPPFSNQKGHLHNIIEQHYFTLSQSQVGGKSDQMDNKYRSTDINMHVVPHKIPQISSQPRIHSDLHQTSSQNAYESQVVSKANQIEWKIGYSNNDSCEIANQTSSQSDIVPKSQVNSVTEYTDSTKYIGKLIPHVSLPSDDPITDQGKILERYIDKKCDSIENKSNISNQSLTIPKSQSETIMELTDIYEGNKSYTCEFCGERFMDLPSVTTHTQTHQKISGEPNMVTQRNDDVLHVSYSENDKKSIENQNNNKMNKRKFEDMRSVTAHTQTHKMIPGEPNMVTHKSNDVLHASYSENDKNSNENQKDNKMNERKSNNLTSVTAHTQTPQMIPSEPKMLKVRSFDMQESYTENYKSNENQNDKKVIKNKCDICGAKYKRISSLVKHSQIVHKIKINHSRSKVTHECRICGAVFEKQQSLWVHNAKHKYICTICKKAHSTKESLESHMMVVHTGDRKYKCTSCGNLYSRKESLNKHIKESCTKQLSLKFCLSHVENNANEIEMVNETTTAQQDSEKLSKSQIIPTENEADLGDDSVVTVICDICGEDFPNKSSLIKHKIKHSHTCTICKKKFYDKSDFKSHMQIHTGEKKYVCEICGMAYIKHSHYVRHTRMHTGEKPYTCEICGHSFYVSSELTAHKIKHREERKYKCSICDKAFKCTKSLKFHSRRHQEISDYKCDVCGKTFTQSGNLKNHRAVHTGEKNHKCLDCGKLFSWKRSLLKHNENCSAKQTS